MPCGTSYYFLTQGINPAAMILSARVSSDTRRGKLSTRVNRSARPHRPTINKPTRLPVQIAGTSRNISAIETYEDLSLEIPINADISEVLSKD